MGSREKKALNRTKEKGLPLRSDRVVRIVRLIPFPCSFVQFLSLPVILNAALYSLSFSLLKLSQAGLRTSVNEDS